MPIVTADLVALGPERLQQLARTLRLRERAERRLAAVTAEIARHDHAIRSIVAGKGSSVIVNGPTPARSTDASARRRERTGKRLIRPIDITEPVPRIIARVLQASDKHLSLTGLVHEVVRRMPGLVKRVGQGRAGDIVSKVIRASERVEIARDGTVTLKASPSMTGRAARLMKSATRAKAKGATFRQLVSAELKKAGRPLHAKDLAARLVDRGFTPSEKKRPFIYAIHSPLGAMMKDGLVKRTAPGTFALAKQEVAG